jgi:hypothetical protein
MALEANDDERRELEYATQFFDFTPDSFVDTISFSSTDIINEELNVKAHLFKKLNIINVVVTNIVVLNSIVEKLSR